jgi:hypothetical protein
VRRGWWALCVLVVAVCAGCERAHGEIEPDAGAEAQIAQLIAARHEGHENGWRLITEAGRVCREVELESLRNWDGDRETELSPWLALADITRGPFPRGGPRKGLEAGERLLAEMEEAGVFSKLRAFAAVGRAWRPVGESGPDARALDEHLKQMPWRGLVRASLARMRLAAVAGDGEKAALILQDLLAISAAEADQLLLLDRLTGIATLGVAAGEVQHLVVDGALDAATCARMLEALDGRRALPPFEETARAEALLQVAMAAEVNAWLRRTSAEERQQAADALRAALSRPEVVAMKAAADEVSPLIGQALDEGPAMLEREDLVEHLAELAAGAVARVRASEVEVQAAVEGTRIMLAMEAYRAAHGGYPEALAALAGGALGEVPVDPVIARSFVYRLLEEADSHGRAYLLYSVGADDVDDGGRTHEKGRDKAWRQSGKGFDFVVNEPRWPAIEREDLEW